MNKKIFFKLIGIISLFAALLLGIFAKEPFINFVVTNSKLVLSGSFSFLFLTVGIFSIGYSAFMKSK